MAGLLLAVFIGTLVAIVLSASYALVLRELRQISANLEQLIELATSRRKIDLSALWSTVPGDAKPAGDDRRGLPSVAMLE